MQRVTTSNHKEMTFLVEDIEAVLEMNRLLEKENQDLKQEISRLKSQVSSLKAHDIERKSILWKKLQYPIIDNTLQQKQQLSSKSEKPAPPTPPPPTSCQQPQPQPPPPPPPVPCKLAAGSRMAVRRVPQVIEFYRYLNKRIGKVENRSNNVSGCLNEGGDNNPRNMIGEIENRSMYLSAVKSDVETQGELIKDIIRDIETARLNDISEVEAFIKRVDEELSSLVDERAVLKHFPQWPEIKADALREAACSFRDLNNLESDILSYNDNPKLPLPQTLPRLQNLQDRLERVIENIERTREGTCKRYKDLQIPWDWMLDTGLVGQIKLHSLRLAKEYMKRIIREFQSSKLSNPQDVLHQGARFAYRVHQFAGGFDLDTEHVFDELKGVHTTLSTS